MLLAAVCAIIETTLIIFYINEAFGQTAERQIEAKIRQKFHDEYALTVVDVASRFKAAEPLSSKDFSRVSKAFQTIYERGPLRLPKVLKVVPRHEFMGDVPREMAKHDVRIR